MVSARLHLLAGRRGLVKEEPWKRGKTNKYNVEDEHYRARLKEAVEKLDHNADANTYASLLQQCGNARALAEGRLVHERATESGHHRDKLVCNFLIFMYGKCRSLDSGKLVFKRMPKKNEFSYSIMLQAFTENGQMREAQEVFEKMPLQAEISWVTMINGYAKNGFSREAEIVFGSLLRRELVAWTAMVTAYAQNGHPYKALKTFQLMDLDGFKPDSIAFISVLDACASVCAIQEGRMIHQESILCGFHLDTRVANMLIHLYGKCGKLDEARELFENMLERTVVTWTTMFVVYGHNGHMEDARAIFDEMPYKNTVSWNAMVAAYEENGYSKKALEIFKLMDLDGTPADTYTYLSTLDACSSIPSLLHGRILHQELREAPHITEPKVGNALINMYSKCGHLYEAVAVFERMPVKILAAWNSMIGAYAQTGKGKEALHMFYIMLLDGQLPDEISFINVLTGCSYTGLAKDGVRLFVSMGSDYGIRRVYDHFVCAVNVLCHGGMLQQAEDLANDMPFVADEIPWTTLLNACRVQKDVDRAARAADRARQLNPKTSAPYVMLSGIYKVDE